MVGDDGIVMEQHKIINQIEKELETLRLENNQFETQIVSLQVAINEQEQFIEELFQDAIRETLSGLHCLWIQGTEELKPDNKYLLEILQTAGLEITKHLASNKELITDTVIKWDFCISMLDEIPEVFANIFAEERIYRPLTQDESSKKDLYQFVKSLSDLKSLIEGDEGNDYSLNTSV